MHSANVTFGFSTTTKFMSWVIRRVLKSYVSHGWIAFDDATLNRRMVLQAETWGYECVPFSYWRTKNIRIAEFEPIGPPLEPHLQWLGGKIGCEYDYSAAFWSGIVQLFKNIGLRIGNVRKGRWGNPNQYMCFEMLVRMLQRAKYGSFEGLDPELANPRDMLGLMFRNPSEFSLRFAHDDIAGCIYGPTTRRICEQRGLITGDSQQAREYAEQDNTDREDSSCGGR